MIFSKDFSRNFLKNKIISYHPRCYYQCNFFGGWTLQEDYNYNIIKYCHNETAKKFYEGKEYIVTAIPAFDFLDDILCLQTDKKIQIKLLDLYTSFKEGDLGAKELEQKILNIINIEIYL